MSQDQPKILFIAEALGKQAFGVSQVVVDLMSCCEQYQLPCKVLAGHFDSMPAQFRSQIENIPMYKLGQQESTFGRIARWHHRMGRFFREQIESFIPDVVHVHGVFTFVQQSAIKAAREAEIPILISSHGMIEPWLWRKHGKGYFWIKKIYWNILLKPTLSQATFTHAITAEEAKVLLKEFPFIHNILIPNAVELSHIAELKINQKPEKLFVFLGRLSPVKGVDLLIRAFKQANFKSDWRLVIAGPDFDQTYARKLRQLVEDLHLSDQVDFIGSVYGEEKYSLLAKAWMLVVPSYAEVVALVNLEAAAVQTPTITTTNTGLQDWAKSGGVLIDTELDQLTHALQRVALWSLEERRARGAQAKAFVQERYSWQVIGQRWVEVYRKIAREGMA